MTILNIVTSISVFSPLVAVVIYLILGNFKSTIINILIGLLFLGLCSDLASKYFSSQAGNQDIIDIYFPANLVVAIILYYSIYLERWHVYQRLITLFLPSLMFCYALVWQKTSDDLNVNWTICTGLIEALAIGHFYVLSKKPVDNIWRHAPYWISIGFFCYSSISMIIFPLHKSLSNNFRWELTEYVWTFHNLLNIIKNICFAIAIWLAANSPHPIENNLKQIFKSLNQVL